MSRLPRLTRDPVMYTPYLGGINDQPRRMTWARAERAIARGAEENDPLRRHKHSFLQWWKQNVT